MQEQCNEHLHVGPGKDHMDVNRKLNTSRTPIKRTVSRITERKSPKGRK